MISQIWRPLENEEVISVSRLSFLLNLMCCTLLSDHLCSHHQHLVQSLMHSKCEGELLDMIAKFVLLSLAVIPCTQTHLCLFISFSSDENSFIFFSFECYTLWWLDDELRKEVIFDIVIRRKCLTTSNRNLPRSSNWFFSLSDFLGTWEKTYSAY